MAVAVAVRHSGTFGSASLWRLSQSSSLRTFRSHRGFGLVDRRAKELGRDLSWEDFMAWDTPWLRACDALFLIAESRGANMEMEEARRLGKTIFHSTSEIPRLERPAHYSHQNSEA